MSDTAIIPTQPTILGLVDKAIENPDFNADALEKLLDMQERVLDRDAKQAFNAAFVQCQATMPSIVKKTENAQTKSTYAKLEEINRYLIPHYTQHGFALSFGTENSPLDNHIRVTGELIHSGGHSKQFYYDSPHDGEGIAGKKNKTAAHARASALTYGQRYLTTIIFNVVVMADDDGNAANSYKEYDQRDYDEFVTAVEENDGFAVAVMDQFMSKIQFIREDYFETFRADKKVGTAKDNVKALVAAGHQEANRMAEELEAHIWSGDMSAISEASDELSNDEKKLIFHRLSQEAKAKLNELKAEAA